VLCVGVVGVDAGDCDSLVKVVGVAETSTGTHLHSINAAPDAYSILTEIDHSYEPPDLIDKVLLYAQITPN